MKKMKLVWVLALVFGCVLAAQEQNLKVEPADKADVSRVANCARKLCAAGMKVGSDDNPYFDYNGMRYTIGAGPTSLAVWVRPIGTTSKKDRKEYVDFGLDGTIDEGSDGSVQRYLRTRGPKPSGLQWRGYYQKGYNEALTAILDYIASHHR